MTTICVDAVGAHAAIIYRSVDSIGSIVIRDMALNWASTEGPDVDFWIDEVALYAGTASPGAVAHPH